MMAKKFSLLSNKHLSCALMKNVTNSKEIREQLVAGELQCTLVKPSLIIDIFQICIAANKAVLSESLEKLITKSIYTEILFNLSLSKNIGQSLVKFGIGDRDSEVLVLSFEDAELNKVLLKISGDLVDMSELSNMANELTIKKIYKISDSELKVSSLKNLIVSKISTKDFVIF